MTVSTTARKQQFVLDGVEDEFTFTFRALTDALSDIKCIATTGGTDTILVYTTEYSVVVNSNGIGGTVTLVDAAAVGGGTLTVYRETTNTQGSDYDDYNQFPADTLEKDLDIRTMVAQELAEAQDRTAVLAISTPAGVSTSLPSPEADKLIGWNAGADALENKDAVAGPTGPTGATGATGSIENLSPTPDDHVGSGIKANMTAGENLVFGDMCYVKSDGKMWKADASVIGTSSAIAMAMATISGDASGSFLFYGFARDDSWAWTVGGLIFLSLTAGGLTQTAPSATGEVIQVIGVATHADRMWMNPGLVQVEHA
jgi:hypothetical protein